MVLSLPPLAHQRIDGRLQLGEQEGLEEYGVGQGPPGITIGPHRMAQPAQGAGEGVENRGVVFDEDDAGQGGDGFSG